jgi:hypothetical protein
MPINKKSPINKLLAHFTAVSGVLYENVVIRRSEAGERLVTRRIMRFLLFLGILGCGIHYRRANILLPLFSLSIRLKIATNCF